MPELQGLWKEVFNWGGFWSRKTKLAFLGHTLFIFVSLNGNLFGNTLHICEISEVDALDYN